MVLDDVSIDIAAGKTTAILGPSGTGKSVLLKIITGLLDPDAGEVIIDGLSMSEMNSLGERLDLRSRMGVLFQGAALFDSLNVFDNVAFPLRYGRKKFPKGEVVERTFKALEDVGLAECPLSMPGEISIGMRKRAGVARALVTEPEVILFDEPNTGLDPEMGQDLYELIVETQKKFGITGIVVSHEIPEVFQVCDSVVMLYQGKVQFNGSVADFNACDSPVVRQFIAGAVEGPIRMN